MASSPSGCPFGHYKALLGPSWFKELIASEMHRYWLQNSPEDFKTILVKFIEWLLARGHTLDTLQPVFTQAALSLDSCTLPSIMSESTKKENILYIHWTYHPKGIQSYEVRQLYNQILKPSLDYDCMTIALSRPKNLRDALTCSALRTQPNLNVQNFVNKLKENPWDKPTKQRYDLTCLSASNCFTSNQSEQPKFLPWIG